MGSDPAEIGPVASLNRPGGNVTGITVFSGPIVSKRFGLLRDLIPGAKVIAVLKAARDLPEGKKESYSNQVRIAADTALRRIEKASKK